MTFAERTQRSFGELGIDVEPMPRILTRMPSDGLVVDTATVITEDGKVINQDVIISPETFAGQLARVHKNAWVGEVGEDGMVEIIVVEHPKK